MDLNAWLFQIEKATTDIAVTVMIVSVIAYSVASFLRYLWRRWNS